MKKNHLFIAAVITTLCAGAQTDSLKRFHWLGFHLDMVLMESTYNQGSREGFQKFVHQNELLNRDLSGYNKDGEHGNVINFNGYFSARVYAGLTGKKIRKSKTEVVAGLRFGNVTLSSAGYSKKSYDTIAVYTNLANGDQLIKVAENYGSYNYTINSKNILIPIGLNVSTNQGHRLWFSAGIELCPGITFGNSFTASHIVSQSELLLDKNSNLDTPGTFSSGQWKTSVIEISSHQLTGLGFSGYATVPLSINLRLSKHVKFLEHMNLSGSLAPGMYAGKNRFTGSSAGFVMNASAGLRYTM